MNICPSCIHYRDTGDMRPLCFFDGLGADCRSRNGDGKCADFNRKALMTTEEIVPPAQQPAPQPPTAAVEETPEGKLFRLVSEREALGAALKQAQEAFDANTFAIADLVPGPEVGQKTKKASDDLKVTVKRALIYKPDAKAMREFCESSTMEDGSAVFAPLKVKTAEELDEKGYKWYQKNHPQLWAKLASFVSSRPAKVSVEVKAAKKK